MKICKDNFMWECKEAYMWKHKKYCICRWEGHLNHGWKIPCKCPTKKGLWWLMIMLIFIFVLIKSEHNGHFPAQQAFYHPQQHQPQNSQSSDGHNHHHSTSITEVSITWCPLYSETVSFLLQCQTLPGTSLPPTNSTSNIQYPTFIIVIPLSKIICSQFISSTCSVYL